MKNKKVGKKHIHKWEIVDYYKPEIINGAITLKPGAVVVACLCGKAKFISLTFI